ncbi:hypothetical protein QAD02_002366 [Eretmocerus hayati]|uniref:Uncharacterized protein n=1 Tax=Eretmocerus hayati TaxID=131215 RepID=A0ACC2NJ35_9HYME|nr:hypothetical protein QAD02_002366 [Eretmocerus hayati]
MDPTGPESASQRSTSVVISSGKKRLRDEDNWKVNQRKRLRNSGAKYTSKRSKAVPAKNFVPVQQCCKNNCYLRVEESEQESSHLHFYDELGDYDTQNYYLSNMMERIPSNRADISWSYSFRSHGFSVPVCRKFLCSVLQIKRGRLTTIQNKLVKNQSLKDCRGKHENHNLKMTIELKNLIKTHCETFDHASTHYTSSSLKYFVDPELNLTKLYGSFCAHHCERFQTSVVPISLTNYLNFFNYELKFGFSQPRTDVCNTCYEFETIGKPSTLYETHKLAVEKHKLSKKAMMCEKNVLCLEFDFGQNLPVPKLPVNDQFYNRLLWLHAFDVNVLNDETRSYMYFFLEGMKKKGTNTVCNFLLDSISRELALNYYDKIYLFCDSCEGQNKNYLILFFSSLLAMTLQLEIQQLFPVRGHSYCSCDRNFGIYGNKKKHMERIETPEDYYKLVEDARNPPFTVIKESDVRLIDFESVVIEKKCMPEGLGIRDTVKITYFPNGEVHMFEAYDSTPNRFIIDHKVTLDDLKNGNEAPPTGIAKEKKADVRSLLRFLHDENRVAIQKFLDQSVIRKKKDVTERERDESVFSGIEVKKKSNKNFLKSNRANAKVNNVKESNKKVLKKNGTIPKVEKKCNPISKRMKENKSTHAVRPRQKQNKSKSELESVLISKDE